MFIMKRLREIGTIVHSGIIQKVAILYNKVYSCFHIYTLGIFGKFGYGTLENKKVESLIILNHDIDILDISEIATGHRIVLDIPNLRKYLMHHIIYTDDMFEKIYFDKPLIIKFKFENEIYQICLNCLESKKSDQKTIIKEPRYLSAVIIEEENETDVTEKIIEFHGPLRNFFRHIPDTAFDISLITEKKGCLHTFNMLGDSYVV